MTGAFLFFSLLLKQVVYLFSGLRRPGATACFATVFPWPEIVAEIGRLLVPDQFSLRLAALVIGCRVEKETIFTAAQRPAATGAGIGTKNLVFYPDRIIASVAAHRSSFADTLNPDYL